MNIDLLVARKAIAKKSIDDLAEETTLAPNTISDLLSGKDRNHGIHTIEKICKALGVPLKDLFDEKKAEKSL